MKIGLKLWETLELAGKNILTVFHIFKKVSRDTEDLKKTQIQFPEMKTTMSEVKNTVVGMNSGLDAGEGEIHELEDKSIQTIQNETQKENLLLLF